MMRFVVSRLRSDPWKLVRWSCAGFVLSLALAMWFYTGGNMADRHAPGYSFWINMLSDLGTTRSWSGRPNYISAGLFALAMTFAGVGTGLYFVTFARRACQGPFSRLPGGFAVLFGLPAAILLVGVACFPANLWPAAHGYCAGRAVGFLAAGMLFQGLALLCSVGASRRAGMTLIVLAILLGAFAFLPRLGLAIHIWPGLMILAVAQKLTVLAAVGGIWVMSWAAGHQRRDSQVPRLLCPAGQPFSGG